MACRPGALSFLFERDRQKLKDELVVLWLIAAAGVLIIWWLPSLAEQVRTVSVWVLRVGSTPMVVMVLAAILLVNVLHAPRQLVAAGLMCLALVTLPSAVRHADSQITQRSFFGVYRVADTTDGYRTLVHGTTLHGAQRAYDEEGNEVEDLVPTTYYYPGGPMGRTIAKRREILGKAKGRYGIVGLGTGSSACHKQEGESWKFFEIDPVVINIASNPKNFTFISKCQPDIDIAIGDARLTIAKEPSSTFDLFIIDAFTSDAIPVHMLTKEAVELFLDKLKPDGVVLLHTSNRYLDLNSVLGAIQKELPEGTAGLAMQDAGGDSYGESGSTVVVFAKSEGALQPYRAMEGVLELDDGSSTGDPQRAWTDDHSDILRAFWRRYKGRG
jgi:hypothetical protein